MDEAIEDYELKKTMGYDEMPLPSSEEKQTIFSFFKKVMNQPLNDKTSNLEEHEIGFSRIPVRTNLELAGYCAAMGMNSLAKCFMDDSQIVLATALSRKGFLIDRAITSKREGRTEIKRNAPLVKRGWFNPAKPGEIEE